MTLAIVKANEKKTLPNARRSLPSPTPIMFPLGPILTCTPLFCFLSKAKFAQLYLPKFFEAFRFLLTYLSPAQSTDEARIDETEFEVYYSLVALLLRGNQPAGTFSISLIFIPFFSSELVTDSSFFSILFSSHRSTSLTSSEYLLTHTRNLRRVDYHAFLFSRISRESKRTSNDNIVRGGKAARRTSKKQSKEDAR